VVVFDNTIVNQVQQANDIVDVVSEHVSLAKKGRGMVGLCPFHDDHRPSMYVNGLKQIFKCFACGAGGDVFKFVQMRENLTFPQAIERLAQRAGIKVKPAKTTKDRTGQKTKDVDPNRLARVNAWAAKYFQQNLADEKRGKQARKYIAERQIDKAGVKKWQIGLAVSNDDLAKKARDQKIPMDLLVEAGLVFNRGGGHFSDKFINRLMFTITDVTGRVIGFGGRALDDKGAKYINSPTTVLFDKSNSLYGLEFARHQIVSCGTVVVVEGYTDCIMAHQFGCTNVVATLGTSLTAGHGRILRRYAKEIVLLFDNDAAGLEAANRALEVCLLRRIDIKLASVPQGKDPCDFLLTSDDSQKRFQELIEIAVDVFKFKWDRLATGFGGDETLVDNKAALEEFLQTIAAAIHSGNLAAVDKGLIVNRLSKVVGLSTKEINTELNKRLATAQRNANYRHVISVENQKAANIDLGQGLFATAQREILEVLLNEPNMFDLVKQKITVENFDVPILGRIAALIFETLSTGQKTSLAAILAKTESVELGQCIVELAESGEEKGNFKARITGAIDVLQRLQVKRTKPEIKTLKDQKKFLRSVCEATEKQNPHSIGMT
jgi:DNA primase